MVFESLSVTGIGIGRLAGFLGLSPLATLSETNPALCGFLVLFAALMIVALIFGFQKPVRTRDPSKIEKRVRFYQDLYSVHRTYRSR